MLPALCGCPLSTFCWTAGGAGDLDVWSFSCSLVIFRVCCFCMFKEDTRVAAVWHSLVKNTASCCTSPRFLFAILYSFTSLMRKCTVLCFFKGIDTKWLAREWSINSAGSIQTRVTKQIAKRIVECTIWREIASDMHIVTVWILEFLRTTCCFSSPQLSATH